MNRITLFCVFLFGLAVPAMADPGNTPPIGSAQVKTYRSAVRRAIPLLQQSAETWYQKKACFSCHHQGLGTLAVSVAKRVGFKIDEDLAVTQIEDIVFGDEPLRQFLLQGIGVINGPISIGIEMPALAEAQCPPTKLTNAMVHYLAGKQSRDGHWYSESHRPPLEDSEYTATAFSIRALQVYRPPARSQEIEERLRRARAWLAQARPRTTEDRSMHLLGLGWSGADPSDVIAIAAEELLEEQRPDGGWAQLPFATSSPPSSNSDAYATGQALAALTQAARMPIGHPAISKGLGYLVQTQRDDGSWHVPSRIRTPANRYFESGFPHGKDQFISYAGSAWATLVLALATDGSVEAQRSGEETIDPTPLLMRIPKDDGRFVAMQNAASIPLDLDGMTPLMEAAVSGSLGEMRFILERGANVNAVSKEGITALHCAVGDSKKVELLLEYGADASARTKLGYTAGVLAGGYGGSFDAMRRLLIEEDGDNLLNEGSALFLASEVGDTEKIEWLLKRGANIDVGMESGSTALVTAARQGDEEMVGFLLEHGAAHGVISRGGMLALALSARFGFADQMTILLDQGAPIDARDQQGMTALMWAARMDPGHDEVIQMLLEAGADRNAVDKNGKTARQHAEEQRHPRLAEALAPKKTESAAGR